MREGLISVKAGAVIGRFDRNDLIAVVRDSCVGDLTGHRIERGVGEGNRTVAGRAQTLQGAHAIRVWGQAGESAEDIGAVMIGQGLSPARGGCIEHVAGEIGEAGLDPGRGAHGRRVQRHRCIEHPVVIEKILTHLDTNAAEFEASRRPPCRAAPQASLFD